MHLTTTLYVILLIKLLAYSMFRDFPLISLCSANKVARDGSIIIQLNVRFQINSYMCVLKIYI